MLSSGKRASCGERLTLIVSLRVDVFIICAGMCVEAGEARERERVAGSSTADILVDRGTLLPITRRRRQA